MSYKHTDIILCYPGIGRTFFTQGETNGNTYVVHGEKRIDSIDHSSFTIDFDYEAGNTAEEFVKEVLCAKESHNYRYILIPIRTTVRAFLRNSGTKYLLVAPKPEDKQAWIKRWLKTGATAELIAKRIEDWDSIGVQFSNENEWCYLNSDEWLGNILQQSPMSDADEKEIMK